MKFGNRIMLTPSDVIFTQVGDVIDTNDRDGRHHVVWSWDVWDLCRLTGVDLRYSNSSGYAQIHITEATLPNMSGAMRDVFITRTVSR